MSTEGATALAVAEQKKVEGNTKLKEGEYRAAVELYTQAIERVLPHEEARQKAAVYYANRCAAHLHLKEPLQALQDANTCISLSEGKWAKAFIRKMEACQALQNAEEAQEAYTKACNLGFVGNVPSASSASRSSTSSAPTTSSTAAPSTPSTTAPSLPSLSPLSLLLQATRFSLLLSTLLLLLGSGQSVYNVALLSTCVCCGIQLYSTFGPLAPHWTQWKQVESLFVQRLLLDVRSHYALYSLLFFWLQPQVVVLLPFVLMEVGHLAFFLDTQFPPPSPTSTSGRPIWSNSSVAKAIASLVVAVRPSVQWLAARVVSLRDPQWHALQTSQKWQAWNSRVLYLCASLEVGTGVFLVVSLFTPYRSVIVTLVIYFFLFCFVFVWFALHCPYVRLASEEQKEKNVKTNNCSKTMKICQVKKGSTEKEERREAE